MDDWWSIPHRAEMMIAVALGLKTAQRLNLGSLERYAGTLAGLAIALSGLAIQVLGI